MPMMKIEIEKTKNRTNAEFCEFTVWMDPLLSMIELYSFINKSQDNYFSLWSQRESNP
jgi:hypothetical protein